MSRRTAILLSFIWIVFLVRGLFYSTFVPIWEGWDEYPHFAYVQYVMNGGGLPPPDARVSAEITRSLELAPVGWSLRERHTSALTHDEYWLLPPSERLARESAMKEIPKELQAKPGVEYLYEGKQAPLYYYLAAAAMKPFAKDSLISRVFVLRLFGILIASSVVFIGFACARILFGSESLALQIAALITAMPQLFVNIARVSNEPVSIAVYSLLAYWLLRVTQGKKNALFYAELTMGVGMLTKAYFVAAAPAVLVAAILVLWSEPRESRLRMAGKIAGVGALALAICVWWYFRALSVSTAPIWEDAAPGFRQSGVGFFPAIIAMKWFGAWDFTLSSHIWLSGWSVLGLRSWIYHAFRFGFVVGYAGLLVYFLKSIPRPRTSVTATLLVALLYAGFLCALLFHAFVSFSKGLPPASGGWYLYAAIVPEVLVIMTGLWQFFPARWRANVVSVVTAAFVLLELYATHFVSIPYYTGIIAHLPSGNLRSFHIHDAAMLGGREILSRILINKPDAIGPALFLVLWGLFLISSVAVVFVARMHSDHGDVSDSRTT